VHEYHQYHKAMVRAENAKTKTTYIQTFDAMVNMFPFVLLSKPKRFEPKNVYLLDQTGFVETERLKS
jgi:hypothetical protein